MRDLRVTRFAGYTALFLCGIAFAADCIQVQAQGMSPVSQEFNKKARGVVEVTNNDTSAKIISCRAQSFDANEHGVPQLSPIDPALHVRIDADRVVLAPKSSRQVSFEADPAALPAWFVVTCRFMPMERGPGLTVAMELSSIVIINGGWHVNDQDVELSAKRMGDKVEVEVKNRGAGLARVSSGEVQGHRKEADIRTFVLFPHQTRLVETDWKGATLPETARIQIGKKRFEAPVN
jgi:hypothetical protein